MASRLVGSGEGPDEQGFLRLPEIGLNLPDFEWEFTAFERPSMPKWKQEVLRREAEANPNELYRLLEDTEWAPLSEAILYAELHGKRESRKYFVANLSMKLGRIRHDASFLQSLCEIKGLAARLEKPCIEVEIYRNDNPYEAMGRAVRSYEKRYLEKQQK